MKNLQIKSKDHNQNTVSIVIDGKEITDIRKLDLHMAVDEVPTLTIERIVLGEISVDTFAVAKEKTPTEK